MPSGVGTGSPAVWGTVDDRGVWDSVEGRLRVRGGVGDGPAVWGGVDGGPADRDRVRGPLRMWGTNRGDMPTMLPRPSRSDAAATRRGTPGRGTRRHATPRHEQPVLARSAREA
ncbi:hypothetical protein ABT288_20000, partial [Streptomyces sp. NPDC001093]|uniref:hypothetical protein n=1 Tax=Streptomyces sp. NPDC001093 TaxID=3154376 RepID=UPI003330E187